MLGFSVRQASYCVSCQFDLRCSPFALRQALSTTVIPSGAKRSGGTCSLEDKRRYCSFESNFSRRRSKPGMTLLYHLRRQFAYEFWANAEVLRALSALADPPSTTVRRMAHIVAAQWLWLDRLQKHPQRCAVWPEFRLAECSTQMQAAAAAWQTYLERLTDDDLAIGCDYTNSKGEVWRNKIVDVISHLLLHSAYHRGQIASDVRQAGGVPAYTDYIHAARQDLLA